MPPPDNEAIKRLRRIETRVTQIAVGLGIGTHAQKPEFDPGGITGSASVTVPSIHSSLKEILDSVPAGWQEAVIVRIGREDLATITPAKH